MLHAMDDVFTGNITFSYQKSYSREQKLLARRERKNAGYIPAKLNKASNERNLTLIALREKSIQEIQLGKDVRP